MKFRDSRKQESGFHPSYSTRKKKKKKEKKRKKTRIQEIRKSELRCFCLYEMHVLEGSELLSIMCQLKQIIPDQSYTNRALIDGVTLLRKFTPDTCKYRDLALLWKYLFCRQESMHWINGILYRGKRQVIVGGTSLRNALKICHYSAGNICADIQTTLSKLRHDFYFHGPHADTRRIVTTYVQECPRGCYSKKRKRTYLVSIDSILPWVHIPPVDEVLHELNSKLYRFYSQVTLTTDAFKTYMTGKLAHFLQDKTGREKEYWSEFKFSLIQRYWQNYLYGIPVIYLLSLQVLDGMLLFYHFCGKHIKRNTYFFSLSFHLLRECFLHEIGQPNLWLSIRDEVINPRYVFNLMVYRALTKKHPICEKLRFLVLPSSGPFPSRDTRMLSETFTRIYKSTGYLDQAYPDCYLYESLVCYEYFFQCRDGIPYSQRLIDVNIDMKEDDEKWVSYYRSLYKNGYLISVYNESNCIRSYYYVNGKM